ncbi:unnamed protein product [Ostreobium quekettii]|uniref:30S ribosomal protein S15 n=1 Tax=Ostreobium quekettii TaxID=121088 RepID=A0A8S1IYY0_9CHLO|nr:unnamed protein product [Ostreobium quekettii]
MSSEERWKLARAKKRADFRRHEMDTGSTEVQVALLSDRISQLQGHLTTHRKDYASLRGLRKIISTRRKLLTYLRNNNFDAYSTLIGRLGLKDEYIKQDRFSKYREAARPQMK